MKKYWIDYLRVLAILAVITIHITVIYYKQFDILEPVGWWAANILSSASKYAVPLFVMISGALLLGRDSTVMDFYRKRVKRLMPPIIFWSIFYIVVRFFQETDMKAFLWYLKVDLLASGRATEHLWYLTMFACLMLFVPFLNMLVSGAKCTSKDMEIFLLLMLALFALNTAAGFASQLRHKNIDWFKSFPWYIAYFVGGYYLDKYAERFNIRSRIMLTIIIAVIICGAVMNYVLAAHFGLIKDYIALGNTGLLVFIMTFMIFLMARKNEYRLPPNKWIIAVSEASFGMYLIHPFFLVLLRGLWPNYQSIQYFPVLMIVVPVVSFFAVTMMRKVEFMRQFC